MDRFRAMITVFVDQRVDFILLSIAHVDNARPASPQRPRIGHLFAIDLDGEAGGKLEARQIDRIFTR